MTIIPSEYKQGLVVQNFDLVSISIWIKNWVNSTMKLMKEMNNISL